MQWLPLVESAMALVAIPLALANAAYFTGYARRPLARSRRVAVLTLVVLNSAVATESAAWLAVALVAAGSPLATGATLLGRTALLFAVTPLSLLIARSRR